MSSQHEHPLFLAGLPEWLASVPIDAEQTWIPVGEGKEIPLKMIFRALEAEVGSIVGSMSISPELANYFIQFTENPSWRNLPKEPTSIERISEVTWKVKVGDYTRTLTRAELTQEVRKVFQGKEEK